MKIVVLCNMGYGSSLILKMKVEEILKAHSLNIEVVALRQGQKGMDDADLIFLSPGLKGDFDEYEDKIITIENFLDPVEIEEEGIRRIREML